MKNRYFFGILAASTLLAYRAGLWTRDSLQQNPHAPSHAYNLTETQRVSLTREFKDLEKSIHNVSAERDKTELIDDDIATRQLHLLKKMTTDSPNINEAQFEFYKSIVTSRTAAWAVRRQAFKNLLPYMGSITASARGQLLSHTDPFIIHTVNLPDSEFITLLTTQNAD